MTEHDPGVSCDCLDELMSNPLSLTLTRLDRLAVERPPPPIVLLPKGKQRSHSVDIAGIDYT